MLDVTQTTLQAAALAHRLTAKMPRGKNLGDQLRRAAESAALNVAEGMALRGARRTNHLSIAYGSCREAQAATMTLAVTEQIDREAGRRLWRLLDRSGAMLWRLTH